MKTLIILRHGKSSWDDSTQRDIDRPLLSKGIRRTQLVADFLKMNNLSPCLIVSSPAVRAFETAKIAAINLDYSIEKISINDDLYFVSVEKYFETVFTTPDECSVLMIVGHNPMITDFCNYFLEKEINNLSTSGLCVVSLNTYKWSEAAKCKATPQHLVFPKLLEKQ